MDCNDSASSVSGWIQTKTRKIFESLNATGRPLTESEKVKNWLLMGLPDAQQQELHDEVWLAIEAALGAEHATAPVDEFLRDLLRWRTGRVQGIDAVYDGLRRWAVRGGYAGDRPGLCRELAKLAKHYGLLTGAVGGHPDRRVERELRHLRAMGVDVHRPLTMRFLHDAEERQASNAELADALGLVGAWITRMWLADRPLAGLNKAVAELAYGAGPREDEDLPDHWRGRIDRLRNGRAGVPHDDAVNEGIRNRKAYGGGATRTAFAVLCAMMEAESREESPARYRLTMEHVMPQKLTPEWRRALGETAEEVHGAYRDRLANLTLSGDATNAGLGTRAFAQKAEVYRNSPIGMTRRVAGEAEWNQEALERRAEQLASEALSLWPWETAGQTAPEEAPFKWRIDGGEWHSEDAGSSLVLNVAGALVAHDPGNVERLSGDTISRDLQPASRIPPDSKSGTLTLRAVPGREDLVIYPYGGNYPESAERCRQMGARCGADVEVLFKDGNRIAAFWRLLKERTGGVPGQRDRWRGPSQWTSTLNPDGDRVGIYVGNPDLLWLYIRSGWGADRTSERAARMRRYSWTIQQTIGDQQLGENLERNADDGVSISVQRPWVRDDEGEWPEVAVWIKEQQERLAAVLADT
ncbi:MAG: HNH endonuclease family protein [Gammaproteobacteria bacterium]|nr:HNH endonuclease family protein [Gammaproteobacteria bacterium]